MTKAVFFERELNGQMKDFCRMKKIIYLLLEHKPSQPPDLGLILS